MGRTNETRNPSERSSLRRTVPFFFFFFNFKKILEPQLSYIIKADNQCYLIQENNIFLYQIKQDIF